MIKYFNHEFDRIIKSLFCFCFLFYLLNILFYNALDSIARKNKFGYYGFEDSVKNKPDIVILGASRAMSHYDPNIIRDSLNLKVFNYGYGGTSIVLQYAELKDLLRYYQPKMIIYELAGNDYDPFFLKSSALKPASYFHQDKYLNNIFITNDKYITFKRLIPLYKYNGDLLDIFLANKRHQKLLISNGYVPLHNAMLSEMLKKEEISEQEETMQQDSSLLREGLALIMALAKKYNVNLMFVRSPIYPDARSNLPLIIDNEVYDDITSSGYCIYNFSITNIPQFGNPNYFKDYIHLTDKGSSIFTQLIIPIIKHNLNNHNNDL